MTSEELLKSACERCEEYGINTKCESQSTCPVYSLYLKGRKSDDWSGTQGNCDFEPLPKAEMI